jgi:hypothetical protein
MALDGGHKPLLMPRSYLDEPVGNLVRVREAAPGVWVPDPVNGTHAVHGLPPGAGTELIAEVRGPEPPAADPADAWWEVTRPLPRRLTWPELTARVPDQPAGMCAACRYQAPVPGQAKCGDCAGLPDRAAVAGELARRAETCAHKQVRDGKCCRCGTVRPATASRTSRAPRIRLGPGLGPRVAVLGIGWALIVIGAHVFLPLSLLGLLLVVMAVVRG